MNDRGNNRSRALWLTREEVDALEPELREEVLSMSAPLNHGIHYDPRRFNALVEFADGDSYEFLDLEDDVELRREVERWRSSGRELVHLRINDEQVPLRSGLWVVDKEVETILPRDHGYSPQCFNATVWFRPEDGDEDLTASVSYYYILDERPFLDCIRSLRDGGFTPVRVEINGRPVALDEGHLWTPVAPELLEAVRRGR